ncbi:MAG: hypothetical protein WBF77_07045 [Sulfurimonadaceae bacterium]
MTTLTPERQEEVAKKDDYITLKEMQLKAYKVLNESLEFADDDFEKSVIQEEMAPLAKEIKTLAQQKIKEIEAYS